MISKVTAVYKYNKLLMILKVLFTDETVPTLTTCVWSLSGVDPHVSLKVSFIREAPPELIT